MTALAQTPEPPLPELDLEARLADACGGDPGLLCEWIYERTEQGWLARLGDFLLGKPLAVLLILVVAFVLTRLLRRAVRRFVTGIDRVSQRATAALGEEGYRAAQRAATLASVLSSVGGALIWTVALLLALGEVGLNLGPLIAGAGIAGIALGFGAQTLVRDFLSGLFMLIEDQYGVGDIVDVGEADGVVERVTLRSTRLRAVDGTVWHVPNGEIKRVGNKSQDWARALLDVFVTLDSDVGLAQSTVRRVAAELVADPEFEPLVLGEPEVWGVEHLGPDGIAIRLVIKTRPAEQWTVARALRERIKAAFDAEGIRVPDTQKVLLTSRHAAGAGGAGGATVAPPS